MLVQSRDVEEPATAQVTLPKLGVRVPRAARGLVRRGPVPADQLLGEDAVRVLGPHRGVHLVAVQSLGDAAAAVL